MAGTVKPLPTPASTNLDNKSENSEGTISHSLAEGLSQGRWPGWRANVLYLNQSIFVYYGMTKCRQTTRSKKAIQLVRKKASLDDKPKN